MTCRVSEAHELDTSYHKWAYSTVCNINNIVTTAGFWVATGNRKAPRFVGWDLMVLSTQFRLYRIFRFAIYHTNSNFWWTFASWVPYLKCASMLVRKVLLLHQMSQTSNVICWRQCTKCSPPDLGDNGHTTLMYNQPCNDSLCSTKNHSQLLKESTNCHKQACHTNNCGTNTQMQHLWHSILVLMAKDVMPQNKECSE